MAHALQARAAHRLATLRLQLLGAVFGLLGFACGLSGLILFIDPSHRATALAIVALFLSGCSVGILVWANARRRAPDPLAASLRDLVDELARLASAAAEQPHSSDELRKSRQQQA